MLCNGNKLQSWRANLITPDQIITQWHLDLTTATRLVDDVALISTVSNCVANITAALPRHRFYCLPNDSSTRDTPGFTVIKSPSTVSILPALPVVRDAALRLDTVQKVLSVIALRYAREGEAVADVYSVRPRTLEFYSPSIARKKCVRCARIVGIWRWKSVRFVLGTVEGFSYIVQALRYWKLQTVRLQQRKWVRKMKTSWSLKRNTKGGYRIWRDEREGNGSLEWDERTSRFKSEIGDVRRSYSDTMQERMCNEKNDDQLCEDDTLERWWWRSGVEERINIQLYIPLKKNLNHSAFLTSQPHRLCLFALARRKVSK
jgi:hypothetical protein